MSNLDKPNVVLPLANTYNERGIAGYTQTVTGGKDQRKVNCWYEPSVNQATGTQTHRVSKRPGVTSTATLFTATVSSHVVKTIYAFAGTGFATPWLFTQSGTSTFANNSSTSNFVTSGFPGGRLPTYVDSMPISGVNTVILQTQSQTGSGATFFHYASDIGSWSNGPSINALGKIVPMDGFLFGLTTTNSVINSNLNDPSTFGATSYITKQIQQDSPVGLMRLGKRVIACGKETMEQFANAGNAAGSPLEVIPSGFQRIGLHKGNYTFGEGQSYYAELSGRLFFCGQSINASAGGSSYLTLGNAQGGIYAFDGNNVEKVSTPFIDKIIMENSFQTIQPFSIMGRNGIAINLATSTSLMFFPDWKEWFEWGTSIFQFVSVGGYYISVNGTNTSDQVFRFASKVDNWQDNGSDYTMTVQFKLPHNGNEHQQIKWMGFKGDTAASTTTSTLNVAITRDDYQTFETARSIDMTKMVKKITRCGAGSDFGIRLTHTGNLDCRLDQFVARIE